MPKLNALVIKSLNDPGKYADGGGLYLSVKTQGAKSWTLRYCLNGKRREMGLGGVDSVSLSDARSKALEIRKTIAAGNDPIEQREIDRQKAILSASRDLTFRVCAAEYIKTQQSAWTSKRQKQQWENCLANHAHDVIGDLPVSKISKDLVIQVLQPIWSTKTTTAGRVLNRIESILDYATVRGYRSGDNPARWKGNLDHVFPSPSKIHKISHMPSMNREDLPEFFVRISGSKDVAECALEFLILTAARTEEVIGMTWIEIEHHEKAWRVPAERMKGRKEHRVPLSDAAMAVLLRMRSMSRNQYVFPGRISGRHLSNMAMLMVMRRFGLSEVPHGFRSTFKDWSSECTSHPDDLSEKALAHAIKNKTKASYQRGDMFEKRRKLMNDWAEFCTSMQTGSGMGSLHAI